MAAGHPALKGSKGAAVALIAQNGKNTNNGVLAFPAGFEPTLSESKSDVLPLNDGNMALAVGFEPTDVSAYCFQDSRHKPLDHTSTVER